MVLNVRLGCEAIQMEALAKDFDGSIARLLRGWGVREGRDECL